MKILRNLTSLLSSVSSSSFQTGKNQKPGPNTLASDPAQVAIDLRNKIFNLSSDEIGPIIYGGLPDVWGAVTEIGYPQTCVSLVTLADGTTSLYFGHGGGVIGGGGYKQVLNASSILLGGYQHYLEQMTPTSSYPVPDPGRVKFYALTYSGLHVIDVSEDDLRTETHELSLLFKAAHEVITELRILDEQGK
jgi:hypothetical protein